MRDTALITVSLLLFLITGFYVDRWDWFGSLRDSLQTRAVPEELLEFGPRGEILRRLGALRSIENDESRFPIAGDFEGEIGVDIFQRKRQVGDTLYEATLRSTEAGPALRISEFMASNARTLPDPHGDFSDWIEIHNPGDTAVDLDRWYLTDDRTYLSFWRFPAVSIEPGGYLIVFASGKDVRRVGRPLHTNFSLKIDGEYLALVRPDGVSIVHEYGPLYPPQQVDFSYGEAPGEEGGQFLLEPTPGRANSAAALGSVAEVRASPGRGFRDEPFYVTLSTTTEGARIRYSTDGNSPGANSGRLYRGPLRVDRTTAVRARAFKPGHRPSLERTFSYLFLDDVPKQGPHPAHFPKRWSKTEADYEMDPHIVGDPFYGKLLGKSLRSLPSLSLVMDLRDLFGPRGIYANPRERGVRWERPCSFELLHQDDTPDFQVNCGARMHGNESRLPHYKKHPFRILFKRVYGDAELAHRLFPDSDADHFDTVILRSADDSWLYYTPNVVKNSQYVRDQWARSTELDMGRLTSHGFWVHLYLNGLYWGIFNLIERPDASFMKAHLGGLKEDYDAARVRFGDVEAVDGDLDAWEDMMEMAEDGLAGDEAYRRIQAEYLDVGNFIDYTLIHFYNGAEDWTLTNGNNLRFARRRGPGEKFRFFTWDSDSTFASGWGNEHAEFDIFPISEDEEEEPSRLFSRLRENPEFRMLFADRAQKHLLGDGELSEQKSRQRFLAEARKIELALIAESARWGDMRRVRPYTRENQWYVKRRWMLKEWFPKRTQILLDQFRENGLYPDVDPPVLSQRGSGTPDVEVRMGLTTASRTTYTTLLSPGAPCRILAADEAPASWTGIGFRDEGWQRGRAAIGYDREGDYEEFIRTDLTKEMYKKHSAAYLRIPFEVDSPQAFDALRLRVKFDDGFIAYLNGREVARENVADETKPGEGPRASGTRPDAEGSRFGRYHISEHLDVLKAGKNVLSVIALNIKARSSDLLLIPKLEAGVTRETPPPADAAIYYDLDGSDPRKPGGAVADSARVYQGPVTVSAGSRVVARTLAAGAWSALTELTPASPSPAK